MVSWAVYPALDPRFPAGLSSTIVQEELRGRLHFQEVTITDAIDAGALQAFGTFEHRALLAAEAGMDLILCASRDVSPGEQALEGLERGYMDGTLDRATFQESLQRIIDLRLSLQGALSAVQ
ncbi:MAG TPA: glycoside hydrolase family 3 N-terminal domain-containing protein [Thermoleophilia bacterium]|nr:glycoside hydrolase family 3 N-terminal domain-containing protein [Thermoleophilia bacterium]